MNTACNCNGYFWWSAFDQGNFDYAPYDWNNIGSEYGLFRSDGTAKPIVETIRKFNTFLANFPYADIPEHMTEAVCIIPHEQECCNITANSAFILAKQAGFDISFAYAEDKLPDSDLYLFPSVTSTKPIFLHRLNELLEKVRNGATLFISTDQLFLRIPELTGLTISAREKADALNVILGEERFVMHDIWKFHIESIADTCTVLAHIEDGEPFFVCNKYGNGKIYYMPYKPELIIGEMTKPFAKDKPAYYKFYEFLVNKNKRVTRSMDPLVLTTEHIVDEQKRIVVAVNYDNCDSAIDLRIADGWQIGKIYYGGEVISANDACVMEVKKQI